jgi:hypothetical protein
VALLQSVATAATAGTATSVSATFVTANLSASSLIVAAFSVAAGGSSPSTTPACTCGGVSMNLRGQITPNGGAGISALVALFDLVVPAGQVGTKPAVQGSWVNAGHGSILAEEVSGLGGTADGSAATKAQNSSGVQPATCNAYSSTAASEYLVAVYGDNGGPATLGACSTGYTADVNNVSANGNADIGIFAKNSTNGAETMSLALTGTVPVWGTILIAYQLPAGPPVARPMLPVLQAVKRGAYY